MTQAQRVTQDGTIQRRWYVYVGRARYVEWATDEAAARRKTEARDNVKRYRLVADRVEAAPPLVEKHTAATRIENKQICWYCHTPLRFDAQRCPQCGEQN